MEQVTLYLNCDDNGITFNKKNFLLRAAERLGFTVKYEDGNTLTYDTDDATHFDIYDTFLNHNENISLFEGLKALELVESLYLS